MLVCLRVSTLRRTVPITSNRADIVLWDSHPLALGATPQQVWIDGIAQLGHASPVPPPSAPPVLVGPPKQGPAFAEAPPVPTWDAERAEAVAA